jgi:ubiquinone/menaquinone biosynthesis C-methylase UbiE
MKKTTDEIEKQKRYYSETANKYESAHIKEKDEHSFALSFLIASLDYLEVKSILDIGSGTGRAIRFIKEHRSDLRIVGIEPVKELREVGYSHGLSAEDLIDGDATKLQFGPSEFDLVCEFAVLHHLRRPELAVSEMLRVSEKAIFISDCNTFGSGSLLSCTMKQLLNYFRLWPLANLIKTKGKIYTKSDCDGIAYSYSVFNNFKQIKKQCKYVHILNTKSGAINPYKTASHVALLGIKK